MGNQGHASPARRQIKEILMTGVIGPVREVHVWADRAWGLQDAASAEKYDQPHGFYNGIQIVDRFKEEMPVPPTLHFDLWLGPAPARPFHATYFPGPRWYRWWDFGNGTMSDLGSHDNDVPYTVLDIRQPLTIEAMSPNVPVAHKELAPATMMVTYEFPASASGTPPVKLVWHQGESKPPGWMPEWGRRSQVFIGDKGMLLGEREAAAGGEVQGLPGAARDAAAIARPLDRVGEPRARAAGRCPAPTSSTPAGPPRRTTSATWPTGPGRRSSGTSRTCAPATRRKAAPFIKRPEYRKGWDDILKRT